MGRQTAQLTVFALALALGHLHLQVMAQTSNFTFNWPTETNECGVSRCFLSTLVRLANSADGDADDQVYPLTWTGGTAPYTAMVLPIYGQPFIYDIGSKYYPISSPGTFNLELQVAEDVPYVVIMRDATGMGAGERIIDFSHSLFL